MRPTSSLRVGALIALLVGSAAPALAAPPVVPTSLPYQGLLLDGLGQPRTGSVDLTLRIWDAVTGGTLVYKQSFPGVALADGVFSVQLGPSGEAGDTPANPLTTDLAAALAGDTGATSPVRFLEVTVGGDGALSRTQILASAYAVRAATAATADSASSASSVGGFSAEYVTQLLTYGDGDGGGPPNTDPAEGIADVDGDGRANFVDADNDGDGITDVFELSQGSGINLVTPTITGIVPPRGTENVQTVVTVTGTSFQPGLAFSIGSQTPAPQNVTPTSFQVTVGPQPPGAVTPVVTLANGESDSLPNGFTFDPSLPTSISGVVHGLGSTGAFFDLDVRPGTTEIVLSGDRQYVTGPAAGPFALHTLASRGGSGSVAVAFDAAGRTSGLRCRDTGAGCVVEVLVDADADGELEDETGAAIQTLNGTATLESAQLARDPSGGGWIAAYVRRTFSGEAVIARDRNADADFADPGEITVLGTAGNLTASKSSLAVDGAGRVAFAYWVSGVGVQLAFDRNGDGDYADTIGGNAETGVLPGAAFDCFDLAFDANDRLVATVNEGAGVHLLRDADGDGDFTGAGEDTLLSTTTTTSCGHVAVMSGQPVAAAWSTALRFDRNADGDFGDTGETTNLVGNSLGSTGDVVLNGTNRAIAAAGTRVYVAPAEPF